MFNECDDMSISGSGPPAAMWPMDGGLPRLLPHQTSDVGSKAHLGVILWLVVDYPTSIGQAPERTSVVGNVIKDMKWHAMFVVDLRRLNGFAEQLLQITLADIARKFPRIAMPGRIDKLVRVDIPGNDNPQLDHLELAREAAACIEKAQRLIGGFGPAIEVVRPGIVFRSDAIAQTGKVGLLIPLRRLVGTGRHYPSHPGFQSQLVDPLHHIDVAALAVVLALRVASLRPIVGRMNHDIGIGEDALQVSGVWREEVDHLDA